MQNIEFIRRAVVAKMFGIGESTTYEYQYAGFIVRPIQLGPRVVGFPKHEIDAICEARLKGASAAEIVALVKQLEASRADGLLAVPAQPKKRKPDAPKIATVDGWTRTTK